MKILKVTAQLPDEALPHADWADKYQLITSKKFGSALSVADQMIGKPPGWINVLLKLRNILVSPFGLKTTDDLSGASQKAIGIFPVLEETDDRVVLGIDDWHLNFRIIINLSEVRQNSTVSATTLIKRNNQFGHIYLSAIMPFHKLIVRYCLRSIAR